MRRLLMLLPALLALQVGVSPALAWTWPADGPVLQPFRFGEDPYEGGQHRGIDVGAPSGAPVAAPAGGTVSFVGSVPGGGKTVTIETPEGYSVTLVHLGSTAVARGDPVAEGAVVGSIGPSGEPEVGEPYVHLGIRVTSEPEGYVDPLALLPARPGAAAPAEVPPASEAPAPEGEASEPAPAPAAPADVAPSPPAPTAQAAEPVDPATSAPATEPAETEAAETVESPVSEPAASEGGKQAGASEGERPATGPVRGAVTPEPAEARPAPRPNVAPPVADHGSLGSVAEPDTVRGNAVAPASGVAKLATKALAPHSEASDPWLTAVKAAGASSDAAAESRPGSSLRLRPETVEGGSPEAVPSVTQRVTDPRRLGEVVRDAVASGMPAVPAPLGGGSHATSTEVTPEPAHGWIWLGGGLLAGSAAALAIRRGRSPGTAALPEVVPPPAAPESASGEFESEADTLRALERELDLILAGDSGTDCRPPPDEPTGPMRPERVATGS